MKTLVSKLYLSVLVLILILSGCSSSPKATTSEKGFTPSKNIEFIVTSSPGGGSDLFARTIADAIAKAGLCDQTFLVNNQTDGNGEVGRLTVATTSGTNSDYMLLSMNSGDCGDMLANTDNRLKNFTPIATMAVDKQLLFVTPQSKYTDFKSILAALDAGETVIMGGSKGSDTTTFKSLLEEISISPDVFKYIVYDSSSDAITALLGNHVDVVISKPGSSLEYVEAGSLIPVLALSDARFSDKLGIAPTLSEVDSKYKDVQEPIWRSVMAPGAMSDEAAAYWNEVMRKVSETDIWQDYLKKNSLISDFRNLEETKAYVEAFEQKYLASVGK